LPKAGYIIFLKKTNAMQYCNIQIILIGGLKFSFNNKTLSSTTAYTGKNDDYNNDDYAAFTPTTSYGRIIRLPECYKIKRVCHD